MPEYQFANREGKIVAEDYDGTSHLSTDQLLRSLQDAFQLFPYDVAIEKNEDVPDVFHVTYPEKDGFKEIFICGKGVTPGGRQGLKDEQRIQLRTKTFNYVYDKNAAGVKGVFLGVYLRDGQTIFCTWKVARSNSDSPETPVSKQIKIGSIAKAIQEGFVQQDKGRGEYACAFRPEFLYFYLRNSEWLHTGAVDELAAHTPPEAKDATEPNVEKGALRFHTGLHADYPRNRILFGAPGTGKSYLMNQQRLELLGENSEINYERVTFHPDYSYANFVGTYKPVMVGGQPISTSDKDTQYILSILTDASKTAQEKYDLLYNDFKGDGLTRLPILLGIYTDEVFKTRKEDGSSAVGNNGVERNHGRAIRKYVAPLMGKGKAGEIAYEYIPGPFMRVYVNALKSARTEDPKPFLLIIEEINRASMATVFGDVFQLLDRNDDEVSEYPIQASEDMKKYLARELGGQPDDYSKICIPDNMFIWATMNSADQGVYPMDTAFKRRWDFTYLGIDESEEGIAGKKVALGQGEYRRIVEWNALRKAINNELLTYKVNEDKLMGPYFLSRKVLPQGDTIDPIEFARVFKNKVIMYLFDDAAKQKRPALFSGCGEKVRNQYSKICSEFDQKGVFIFCESISSQFPDTIIEDDGT